MKWKKAISIAANVAVLLIVAAYFEGQLRAWGIISFILFHVVVAGWRLYKSRRAFKSLLEIAGAYGEKHKLEAMKHKQK